MAAGDQKEVAVTGRETGSTGGLTKKSSNPQEDFRARGTTDVVNVRVGSEAAVDSGTGPVLPVGGASISEATKVHNRDLQERDRKEFEKRGIGHPLAEDVSVSWSGLRMVSVDDAVEEPRSGGGTFRVKNSLSIRRLTPEEETHFSPGGTIRARRASDANQQNSNVRASDAVKGSGAGGGGNPMAAGAARGATSEPAPRTVAATNTSAGAQQGGPQGGGQTTRNR